MPTHLQVAEMASGSYWHLAFLRWSMGAIFIWFGIQKFTPYAAEAIAPLIANSPFTSWLSVFGVRGEARVIGTIELTTAAVLIIGSMIPIASAVGAAMACVTFLLTTSFFFSTPGITQRSSTGFDHLDVARAVSAEGHCAACCVRYAGSRICVAVTCVSREPLSV